eukprot:GILI01010008.1.p1 GENE.GILI01010008.1~~GILI01010008.1.p1  ORF type:complete len:262 (-),score=45.31 GILI01010008.1:48-800(-)
MSSESTEWDDIQRRFGNLPEKEKEITQQELTEMLIAAAEAYDPLANKSLDELNELEDDLDERTLEEYRRKRIAEMQEKAMKARFGDVRHINRADFTQEVNNAGENVWVVLHLYQDTVIECVLLNRILAQLASSHRATKFLKSKSTECIPNYPDSNLPTILIYQNGECVKQIIGAADFGGKQMKSDNVEWVLSRFGCVDTDMEEDPREEGSRGSIQVARKTNKSLEDEDESEEEDDRCYSTLSQRIGYYRK